MVFAPQCACFARDLGPSKAKALRQYVLTAHSFDRGNTLPTYVEPYFFRGLGPLPKRIAGSHEQKEIAVYSGVGDV